MKNKVFCEECRKDVDYSIATERMEGIIKGKTYSYIGKVAKCVECGNEVYVAEINDYNLEKLYKKYNKMR
ncbi:hypothetical protein [Thomasclavelia sp.]|uniref:hypothetical protein n=1 Tax=Thomasclavelia sp. TaxID=3025757 RepID=UPI0025F26E9E|nr:hypothetical protein [Thomasclavelia sp.]